MVIRARLVSVSNFAYHIEFDSVDVVYVKVSGLTQYICQVF
jgi:hypothetical protein